MSAKYKITKRTDKKVKKNLESDLILVVKNNNNVYKQDIIKNINNGEYKVNTLFNIPVMNRKKMSNIDIKNILKDKVIFKQNFNQKDKQNEPIEMSLINKNNIDVRLLNNNQWVFLFDYSNKQQRRTMTPIKNNDGTLFKFKGSYNELQNILSTYIYESWEFLEACEHVELITPIQFINNNNIPLNFHFIRHNGEDNYYIEKKRKYADIVNLFNEKIEAIENPDSKNCVIFFFEELKKKNSRKIFTTILKELVELEINKKTIYLNDFKAILEKNEITIYLYSVRGLEYSKYSKQYTEISKEQTIILYITDNHIYRVYSKKHKDHMTKKSNTNYDNMTLLINDKVNKDILLSSTLASIKIQDGLINNTNDINNNINTTINNIVEFLLIDNKNNKLITNNKNSLIVASFINKLGYDKKLYNSNYTNFITRIKDKYNINNYSLFPYNINFDVIKYKNNDIKQTNITKLINFDKNKCYSNALYDAPFIPIFNIFSDKKRAFVKDEIINENYLYFIEVNEPNYIYFNNGFWFGWFINKYGGEKYINIKYVFECNILKKDDVIINPYSVLIQNLYDIAETQEEIKFIKESINAHIGQMMKPEAKTYTIKENLTCNTYNDTLLKYTPTDKEIEEYNNNNYDIDTGEKKIIDKNNITEGDRINLMILKNNYVSIPDSFDEDIYYSYETREKINMNMGEDNKPLNILIKNIAQSYLIELINNIKTHDGKPLNKDDIIEINTDCLYITNSDKYNLNDIIINEPNNWKCWKIEKGYKETQLTEKFHYLNNNELVKEAYFYETNTNKYNFNVEYAGGGKTYRIKAIIKQKLIDDPNYSYIIISPHHDFLTDYRQNNLKCSTIAHYTFNNLKIKEKNIYVDEFGICNINDIIYLTRHENKIFYFYGDDKQLEPVESKLLNNEFIKSIAKKYNTNWTNKRNTFKKEFYDELIKEKNITKINKIVDEFNAPLENTDIIIAYKRDTVEKYNNLMLSKYNKKFDKIDIDINIPIINTKNNYALKNVSTNENEAIYNKHSFNIETKINDTLYIINDKLTRYYITKDELLLNFKLGYCITLYASQGKTFNTFHFVKEDIQALRLNGALYTLISRLRFNDEEEYKIKIKEMNITQTNINIKKEQEEMKIMMIQLLN